MTRVAALLSVLLALSLVPPAAAVGPTLGTAHGSGGILASAGDIRYVAGSLGSTTTLTAVDADGAVLRRGRIAGSWGIPLVTLNGEAGGLSADGRLLVLSDDTAPNGNLRARSGFVIASTRTLKPTQRIELRGEFSFDALSPSGSTLFLIQHASATNVASYRVRAYDLVSRTLLPGVIADKRQAGWTMDGFPVARATSADGRFVYTLYDQSNNYPFVHALDTVERTAVCIGLPWDWARARDAIMTATLSLGHGKLRIDGGSGSTARFLLDTRTFRVSASGEHTTT